MHINLSKHVLTYLSNFIFFNFIRITKPKVLHVLAQLNHHSILNEVFTIIHFTIDNFILKVILHKTNNSIDRNGRNES